MVVFLKNLSQMNCFKWTVSGVAFKQTNSSKHWSSDSCWGLKIFALLFRSLKIVYAWLPIVALTTSKRMGDNKEFNDSAIFGKPDMYKVNNFKQTVTGCMWPGTYCDRRCLLKWATTIKSLSHHSLLPMSQTMYITVHKLSEHSMLEPRSNSVLRGQKHPLNYNDK